MIEIFTLLTLVILGMFLVILEVIFIPGTTVVGILGFLCLIAGVYVSYNTYGKIAGHSVFAGTTLLMLAAILYSLKTKAWKKFSLNDEIKSKVNDDIKLDIEVGEVVKTISALRPSGTVEFNNVQFEVSTTGEFIEQGKSVKIIQINNKEIIVEPINN